MSEDGQTLSASQPQTLEEALCEIERLRAQLELHAPVRASQEPIAIIGMGCRFPGGVNTPEAFWELLSSGEEALGDMPASRWDVDAYYDPEMSVPGKMYVRQGSFLDEIDQFDPRFFGMSPREAASLDPQQRLLLEVSWEALEHAGIAPSQLKGSQTGIFVGQYWDDYSMQRIYSNALAQIDRYAQLSGLRGLSAGRIAHVLDVHGPTMQVDTACSSASLAVHLACQSLRNRESDLALAGGVSLILAPEHLIGICQMKALSPDGRCKTFDAKADGFGQGEGCGVVALKRLSDATADGDRILALIRGSAVNHDGHSRTVTTPSGPAQRAMLQQALDNAGVNPHQLDYIEAHGTGTPLGDPIEVMAIARVLCQARHHPLFIGSVKTNVGHLDAAAGVAGLMKVVLSLQHGAIPPQLHFSEPNPRIPWDDWPIRVPTALTPWRAAQKMAGVSAFGMSGTNVHLIVEQAPEPAAIATSQPASRSLHLLPLSAQDPETLHNLAQAYLTHLKTHLDDDDNDDHTWGDTCFTAATGRTHFNHRLAVVADSPEAIRDELANFLDHGHSRWLFANAVSRKRPKIAFLFTGQGAQYVGMGRHLYETQPTFRFWLDRCADILSAHLDQPLLDVLWSGDAIDQTAYTQPALFAVEYALAQVWRSWGIEPDVMMGHSVGEYVAACLAGVFTLEEGLKLIAARGRFMQSLPAGGEMVSVLADEAAVAASIARYPDDVAIAAVNGPQSIVISGQGAIIQQVVADLQAQGIKTRQLMVSHAFHSPLMEPILQAFAHVADQITYAPPTQTIVSNVTGKAMSDDLATPAYWVQHLRHAVRFADGMTTLQTMNIDTFVEIGPKPTLLGLGRGCLPPEYDAWFPSLRPDAEWLTLLASAAQMYVRGAEIDWAGFFMNPDGVRHYRKVALPTYPWRRQRYWTDVVATQPVTQMLHPLVHHRIHSALQPIVFESQLSAGSPAYLADHSAFGNVILPASAYLEMALMAGRDLLGAEPCLSVSDVSIQQALLLTDTPCTVQLIVTPDEGVYPFELFSLDASTPDERWIRHASGRISRGDGRISKIDLKTRKTQCAEPVAMDVYHQHFTDRGMAYGPAFQAIDAIYLASTEPNTALSRVQLPNAATSVGDTGAYHLHPILLDACFRVSEILFQDRDEDRLYLSFGLTALHVLTAPKGSVWVVATRAQATQQENTRVVDLQLFDEDGTRVATVDGLMLRAASVSALQRQADVARQASTFSHLTDWLYQLNWQPQKAQNRAAPGQDESGLGVWLILADNGGVGAQLAEQLVQQGESNLLAFVGPHYQQMAANRYQLNPAMRSDFDQFITEALPGPLLGIIHLWSLSVQEGGYGHGTASVLHLVQALNRAGITVPLWLVTSGTQAVERADQSAQSVWQAPLWGLGRVIQAEHPELACVCVDLDPDATALPFLRDELRARDGENQIAFRNGQRYVARLAHVNLVKHESPLRVHRDAAYLITGGLGTLGLHMAEHLVVEGARHLLLSGRSGATSPEQQATIQQLEVQGADIQVIKADVSNEADVARLLAHAKQPLRGIIHAAGVLDDGMLMQQTAARFEHVAAPKVQGAWHLHTQTLSQPLDFFVLFSSVASLLGSTGQANYAAANAFMDGLAHHRRAGGRPALSINWGPWADVGMAATEPVKRRLAYEGWGTITAPQGWQITQTLLQHDVVQAGALPINWATLMQQVPGAAQSPLLSDFAETVRPAVQPTTPKVHAIAEQLQTASADERLERLAAYIQERAAQTLRVPVSQLDAQESLTNLGIDSLIAVELRNWVRNDLDVDVPMEHFLTTPTLNDLAAAINDQWVSVSPGQSDAVAPAVPTLKSSWIIYPRPRPQARTRLFCFPYAGGGASAFRDWPEALPAEIELCLVQLPGREERLQEDAFTNLSSLADALLPALQPHLDKPFAFFGHSMGAMIAFEVARQLHKQHGPEPMHMLISSRSAPQIANPGTSLRFLPPLEFMETLQRLYGAVPDVIRQNAELQDVFLPILRADVTLLETHTYVPGEPLQCPISVFGGAQDQSITHDALAAWCEQTCASFTQHMFPGDHFYIHHARSALTSVIARELLIRTT